MNNNTHKGKYTVKNIGKYKGDFQNVFYRSSWELKCMNFFDLNESIEQWSNEEIAIPYKSPFDGKVHRYFPDFLVEFTDKNGNKKTWLVEVKPKKYLKEPPANPKRKSKEWEYKVREYIRNQAKWDAAKKYCEERGLEFVILTEDDIFNK